VERLTKCPSERHKLHTQAGITAGARGLRLASDPQETYTTVQGINRRLDNVPCSIVLALPFTLLVCSEQLAHRDPDFHGRACE
jgi:hypothetical protein